MLPEIDFAAHARSLGAVAEKVAGIAELEQALARARGNKTTSVVVIDTDPMVVTDAGGFWWDVAVPEVSRARKCGRRGKTYVRALRAATASATELRRDEEHTAI